MKSSNTSASGGYLQPSFPPSVSFGDELVDFLQAWVVGITNYPTDKVRPRWQPEPANIPDGDWMAFGIMSKESDPFIYTEQSDALTTIVVRNETLHLMASFYGPNADSYASALRDGMQIQQNLEPLSLNNMGLVGSGDTTTLPELIKEIWLFRVDLPFSIKREVIRNYNVETLLSAKAVLDNENYLTNIATG